MPVFRSSAPASPLGRNVWGSHRKTRRQRVVEASRVRSVTRSAASLSWTGLLVLPWFSACVLFIASQRPDYFHATKAISELGAIGAPYAVWMNLLGFVATGALIGLFGLGCRGLPKRVAPDYRLMLTTALLFALTAIPISMEGGEPDYGATSTRLHVLFVLLAPLPWCWALWDHAASAYRAADSTVAMVSLVCLAGFSATAGANLLDTVPGMPGALQRVSFGFFLSWFGIMGWILMRRRASRHGDQIGVSHP